MVILENELSLLHDLPTLFLDVLDEREKRAKHIEEFHTELLVYGDKSEKI